jgi:hypothetical protein
MAESQDPHVIASGHPFQNRAVDLGQAEIGEDGNVYLLRRLSPAIVYALSPGGEVVKRFTINPGHDDYMPNAMHISGSRIVLMFWEPQTHATIFKVTDLEGHELQTYEETPTDGKPTLGGAFACYSLNPERFTFLFTSDDGYLGFRIAEPR